MPIIDSYPPPDPKSASMPDLEHVIETVRGSQAWDFSTKAGLCAYHNACVVALHEADPGFGHLVKTEGQNHCTDPGGRYCATDVAMYLHTGQVVDFIESAGYGDPPPPNGVCWQPGPMYEYPGSSWIEPMAGEDTGDGGGGTTPPVDEDIHAQLDRIEALCSNMNAQFNLMATEINNSRVAMDRPLTGEMVKQGQQLTLRPS